MVLISFPLGSLITKKLPRFQTLGADMTLSAESSIPFRRKVGHPKNAQKADPIIVVGVRPASNNFNANVNDNADTINFPREELIPSLQEVENTVGQVQQVGPVVENFSQRVHQIVIDTLKPPIEAMFPFFKKARDQAISETTQMSQDAIQSSGIDKTMADAVQQATNVIEAAKPIASSVMETITVAEPVVMAETSGALLFTCMLLPPIWSVISFGACGHKGTCKRPGLGDSQEMGKKEKRKEKTDRVIGHL